MYKIGFLVSLVLFGSNTKRDKTYAKNYFASGQIASEGWTIENKKTDYWYFYRENGFKKEEGHYASDQRTKWWIFYDTQEKVSAKCEYKGDKLEGFAIIYKNGKLIRAEKYKMGIQIKQWTSLSEFRKDNSDLTLR